MKNLDSARRESISLSEEWVALSEAMYGPEFISELADFLEQQDVHELLECGCGDGHVLKGLAEKGIKAVGVDASQEMISLARRRNKNPNIDYKYMSWLDVAQLGRSFDAVMCRGNSLLDVAGWLIKKKEDFNPEKARALIVESLRKMFSAVKSGGLLYVDVTSQTEIDQGGGHKRIKIAGIDLEGDIEYDWNKRARSIHGEGTVNGKYFKGGNVGYLITPKELRQIIIKELHPKEIWFQDLPHEINYQIICVRK